VSQGATGGLKDNLVSGETNKDRPHMRNLLLFFGLLVAYTFIYTGLSKFWHGVTVFPAAAGA